MDTGEPSGGASIHQKRPRARADLQRGTWADYMIILLLVLVAASSLAERGGGVFVLPGQGAEPPAEAEPYRTLGALFPDVHAQIVAQAPSARTDALAHWLQGRSAAVAAAPDGEMLALGGSYLQLLRGVRALDPVLCGQLVRGDAGAAAGLAAPLPSLAEQLRRRYLAVEIRAAKAGSASPDPPKLTLRRSDALALDGVLRHAGHARALLVVRHPARMRLARVCDEGVALEEAILTLPPPQAAQIQRSVLGDVWRLPD